MLFSLPMLAVDAIELPWRTYLPALFTETLGLPLAAVGALLMAIRLFDMMLDPAIGWASDRYPTRFGQRKPWMVASIPFLLLGGWQVYFAVPGTGFALLAFWCMVLHLGYTMMVTPHGAWSLEVGQDSYDRTRVMVARTWLAVAGMPLVVLLPSILERGFGATRAEQVGAMGLLLIVLAPVAILLVVRFIAEPAADRAVAVRTIDPFRQFLAMLRAPELRVIVILYALAGLAEASSSGTFIFFVEYVLGLKGWASALILFQSLIVLIALPCWAAISHRLDKRRALMLVYAWQVASIAIALFLPSGMIWPFVAFLLVRSVAAGGDFLLLRSMVADISGRDSANGLRRSGSYYALFNVTLKLAMSLGAGAALGLLAVVGFAPGAETSSGAALAAVRWVYALPTCFSGLAGILILMGGDPRGRTLRPFDVPCLGRTLRKAR